MTKTSLSKQVQQIDVLSDLAELSTVRTFCQHVVAAHSIAECEELLSRMQLGVVEAVANVIKHGYRMRDDQTIECSAWAEDGRLCVQILHDGKPFSSPAQIREVDEPLEGGMGLFLIEQCTDEVSYQTVESRQSIRLVFNL